MYRLSVLLPLTALFSLGPVNVCARNLPILASTATTAVLQNAEARMAIGEHADAQDLFLAALDLLRLDEDPDAELHLDALIGLGSAYAEEGIYSQALESLEQAAELSRREYGLFNERLLEILYRMEHVALAASENELAAELAGRTQDITWRKLTEDIRQIRETDNPDPLDLLEANLALARWLANRPGQPVDTVYYSWSQAAREIYVDALDVVKDKLDNNSGLKVHVLQLMAEDVGRFTRMEPSELIRAERLAKRTNNTDLQVKVLLDIGDWRLRGGNGRLAIKAFQSAWDLLEDTDETGTTRQQVLTQPQILSAGLTFPSRLPGVFSVEPESPFSASGHVELEFTVDEYGRARDIQVLRAEPEWASEAAVARIRSTRFRPGFESDRFISTRVRHIWAFTYDEASADRMGLTAVNLYD